MQLKSTAKFQFLLRGSCIALTSLIILIFLRLTFSFLHALFRISNKTCIPLILHVFISGSIVWQKHSLTKFVNALRVSDTIMVLPPRIAKAMRCRVLKPEVMERDMHIMG